MLRTGVLLLLALPFSAMAAEVVTGAAAADRLDRLIGASTSLRAEFTQTVLDPDGVVLQRARGSFVASRPQRLHWRLDEPSPQLLVTDGETVWLYDQELEQVTISPFDDRQVEAPMLVLSGRTRELLARYAVEAIGDGGDARFVLTPAGGAADGAMTFARLELIFEQGDIRAMRTVDALDQHTEFAFESVSHPDAVDPALFSFVPPESVEIVRR